MNRPWSAAFFSSMFRFSVFFLVYTLLTLFCGFCFLLPHILPLWNLYHLFLPFFLLSLEFYIPVILVVSETLDHHPTTKNPTSSFYLIFFFSFFFLFRSSNFIVLHWISPASTPTATGVSSSPLSPHRHPDTLNIFLQPSYIKFLRFFELCLSRVISSSFLLLSFATHGARHPRDNPVYLSDKRPINLFALSPTPCPHPPSLWALRQRAPICRFTTDMAPATDSLQKDSYSRYRHEIGWEMVKRWNSGMKD